jgi:hypothetical protein
MIMAKKGTVKLVLCQGVEGQCIYLNDYRIAGPKPWGGGRTLHTWVVSVDDLTRAIDGLLVADNPARDHDPSATS